MLGVHTTSGVCDSENSTLEVSALLELGWGVSAFLHCHIHWVQSSLVVGKNQEEAGKAVPSPLGNISRGSSSNNIQIHEDIAMQPSKASMQGLPNLCSTHKWMGWVDGRMGGVEANRVLSTNENPRTQKRYTNSWKLLLSLDTEAHVNFSQGEPPELIQSLLIISWHINFKTFFICTRMYLFACVSTCEARRSSMVSMFLSHASYFFETRFLTKPRACQLVDCQSAALQILLFCPRPFTTGTGGQNHACSACSYRLSHLPIPA